MGKVTAPHNLPIQCTILTYYLTSDSIIKFDSCLISPNCRGMMDGWSFEASRVIRSIINNLPPSANWGLTRQRARGMRNITDLAIITALSGDIIYDASLALAANINPHNEHFVFMVFINNFHVNYNLDSCLDARHISLDMIHGYFHMESNHPNLLLHWLWDWRDSALLGVRLDTDDNNWLSRHGRDSSAPDRQGRPAQAQVATLEQRLCQEPIPRSVGSSTIETRRLWLWDRGHRRNRNSVAAEWIRASGVKREKRRRQRGIILLVCPTFLQCWRLEK